MRRRDTAPGRPLLAALLCVLSGALLAACGSEETGGGTDGEGAASRVVTTRTLGLTYLQQNQLEQAEEQFRELVEMVPEDALGHANLGLVLLRTGRVDAAEKRLRRAQELAPDDPRVNLILARLLQETERTAEATELLRRSVEANPDHLKSLYLLAGLMDGEAGDGLEARRRYLRRAVDAAPGNRAARLDLAEVLLRLDRTDSAAAQFEEVRQLEPTPSGDAEEALSRALEAARAGNGEAAREALATLRERLEVTPAFQRERRALAGPVGNLEGYPVLTFSRGVQTQISEEGAVLEALTFTNASDAAGFRDQASGDPVAGDLPLDAADFDGDGEVDLAASRSSAEPDRAVLYGNDLGTFSVVPDSIGIGAAPDVRAARFTDYDNDGRLDLYLVRRGPNRLYRRTPNGGYREVASEAGVADTGSGHDAIFADLDHDGDLDLYVVNQGSDRYYRNDGDGTFTERTSEAGFAEGAGRAGREAVIGYFNDDAVVDLLVTGAGGGTTLYRNLRRGRFEPAAAEAGFEGLGAASAAVGDYDNDGDEDVFLGLSGGGGQFLENDGDGSFRRTSPGPGPDALEGVEVRDAAFLDFDNDGHLDLAAVGRSPGDRRGVVLLHNRGDGTFEDLSSKLPSEPGEGVALATLDYNDDGDLDLVVVDASGRKHLLRNDGGNANRHLGLQLVGLGIGSGKVNRLGVGARVEIRAGDLRQVRTVRGSRIHVGLADHRRPDVVRIRWTNGVPQDMYLAAGDQEAVQDQTLKGSCAFLYTWNGRETQFVTDFVWRSALGMPVGIMGEGARSYAPPDASREYVRIPGDALAPRNGSYELQVTEELWETVYLDELRLVTVDHPDSVEIYIDRRFRPSNRPPGDRIYAVSRHRTPVAARDGRGRDVLPQLRREDDVHVANFALGPYQGLAEMHDLVLEPGELPEGERVFLFLSGWVYPTDASINVALAQSDSLRTVPPRLQVRDEDGGWRTVIENIGFPAGKEKTVVVELTDRFLSADRSVRIRTNLQVYWDRAFFATGDLRAAVRRTDLSPDDADLHYRGFSRLYRKGGRNGPHWFDYDSTTVRSPWLPIEGPFTRYGDVTSMLQATDDRYVVAGPGDEITVRFDAGESPEVPPGWSRDFLLYSDGWIKDADLNTATGHRVGPLPFHGMARYPYDDSTAFPRDSADRVFVEQTLTRPSPGLPENGHR